LMINVLRMIVATGRGEVQRPIATNCAAPAKTVVLIRPAAGGESPTCLASTPQTTPITRALGSSGSVRRAPSQAPSRLNRADSGEPSTSGSGTESTMGVDSTSDALTSWPPQIVSETRHARDVTRAVIEW